MSASMLRRGLEMLNDDLKDVSSNQKPKKRRSFPETRSKQQGPMPGKAGLKDLISSDRKGVRKQIRRLQGRPGSGKSKATVKDKMIKSAVEEYRKKQRNSVLNANLRYFLGTCHEAEGAAAKKVLRQNSGRQSRSRPDRPVRKAQEKSVFTEEEFQQFQKEYFGRTVEEQ